MMISLSVIIMSGDSVCVGIRIVTTRSYCSRAALQRCRRGALLPARLLLAFKLLDTFFGRSQIANAVHVGNPEGRGAAAPLAAVNEQTGRNLTQLPGSSRCSGRLVGSHCGARNCVSRVGGAGAGPHNVWGHDDGCSHGVRLLHLVCGARRRGGGCRGCGRRHVRRYLALFPFPPLLHVCVTLFSHRCFIAGVLVFNLSCLRRTQQDSQRGAGACYFSFLFIFHHHHCLLLNPICKCVLLQLIGFRQRDLVNLRLLPLHYRLFHCQHGFLPLPGKAGKVLPDPLPLCQRQNYRMHFCYRLFEDRPNVGVLPIRRVLEVSEDFKVRKFFLVHRHRAHANHVRDVDRQRLDHFLVVGEILRVEHALRPDVDPGSDFVPTIVVEDALQRVVDPRFGLLEIEGGRRPMVG
mmetsp:Transcript_19276/g.48224  ORF Transcript_19276/g.48224 Transcript_19276/m.48224 type:complete len:406 (+) Transcript_19276:802-2019(+)